MYVCVYTIVYIFTMITAAHWGGFIAVYFPIGSV
jgi:hypothetical protein